MISPRLLAIAMVLTSGPAWAQEPLSLNGFLTHVRSAYPKLRGATAERQIATAKTLSKQGAFDPSVGIGIESQRFNSSTTRGKASRFSGSTLEWEGMNPDGTKWRFGRTANVGSVKSPASSTGSAGTYYAELKIPILRNRGINEKSIALGQAQLGEKAAEADLNATQRDVFREAAIAYVKWAASVEKREVARTLLAVAERRLAGVYREIETRQRADIEGTEAEAEVDLRRAALASAERSVDEAALKMDKFLWDGRKAADLTPNRLPRPMLTTADAAALAERSAMENRPELRALRRESEIARLDGALARNDRRWSVDLVVAPGRDLGTRGIGETLKAGVAASVPLYQREARGREEVARLKQVKIELTMDQEKRAAVLEVQDSVSALNRSYERFLAASANYERTKKVEDGEIRLFKEGTSDLFRVNLRERATAESASRRIDVQADWTMARISLLSATMEILGEGIDVELSGVR